MRAGFVYVGSALVEAVRSRAGLQAARAGAAGGSGAELLLQGVVVVVYECVTSQ